MSTLVKSMVIYEVLSFLDLKEQFRLQLISRLFYQRLVPYLI